jgi:hypothetical protein
VREALRDIGGRGPDDLADLGPGIDDR